ncbi:hypothetical protein BJ508DRAFT_308332 [Ascobolus immersus RN42]|uniref:Uncharacterized protein n=1 Tax=Ascobolus immersus RN42 TaxID=1160509 RepID=A0A3N4I1S9_ASCIM|nr:hypothetical protein BJ508DRAFT_308332 [Ascobolus immersus RN42]
MAPSEAYNCSVLNCTCEGFLPTRNSTKCASCSHPQATHSESPTMDPPPSSQPRPSNLTAQQHQHQQEVLYMGSRPLSLSQPTTSTSNALYNVNASASTMYEVNQAQRFAENRAQQERGRDDSARLPRLPMHVGMLHGALQRRSDEVMELAVVLFTREYGKHASRKPFVLRKEFQLNMTLSSWHIYLLDIALSHPAWIERNPDECLVYDDNEARGLWVGEAQGREHDLPVKLIERSFSGSVRSLLVYALGALYQDSQSSSSSSAAKRTASKKPSQLRALAISLPVKCIIEDDEVVPPPSRFKREKTIPTRTPDRKGKGRARDSVPPSSSVAKAAKRGLSEDSQEDIDYGRKRLHQNTSAGNEEPEEDDSGAHSEAQDDIQ